MKKKIENKTKKTMVLRDGKIMLTKNEKKIEKKRRGFE